MKRLLLASAFLLALTLGLRAHADTFGFARITDGNGVNPASQFSVSVTDPAGPGNVAFTFSNAVGIPANISEIYFDDGFLGAPLITQSSTGSTPVNFVLGASPANLPGGQSINPDFVSDTSDSVQAKNPAPKNGLNEAGDSLTLTFGLGGYGSFADVVNAMQNPTDGHLRIGLHVQSIGAAGGSDSFVSVANGRVPDGGSTLALLGLAISGTGWIVRRQSKRFPHR